MEMNEQVYVTFIRTTAGQLWSAITNPEFTRHYWGGGDNVSDWKKGSKWRHIGEGAKREVYVTGEVVESIPPKRLVITWANPGDATDSSRVIFELEPIEDLVRLSVTHGGFKAGTDMAANVAWGWPRVLSSLKSFLETGKGINVWAGHSRD